MSLTVFMQCECMCTDDGHKVHLPKNMQTGCVLLEPLFAFLAWEHTLGIAQLVECQPCDRKVPCSSRSCKRTLLQSSLSALTLVRCPLHPSVTAVAHKRPWSFCKSAGGRLRFSTHAPFIQGSQSGLTMPSRHSVGTDQGNKLTHNLSGNAHLQSSRLAEPL